MSVKVRLSQYVALCVYVYDERTWVVKVKK
jgi:hypothetical protein